MHGVSGRDASSRRKESFSCPRLVPPSDLSEVLDSFGEIVILFAIRQISAVRRQAIHTNGNSIACGLSGTRRNRLTAAWFSDRFDSGRWAGCPFLDADNHRMDCGIRRVGGGDSTRQPRMARWGYADGRVKALGWPPAGMCGRLWHGIIHGVSSPDGAVGVRHPHKLQLMTGGTPCGHPKR